MDTLNSPLARRQYLMALMYVSGHSKNSIASRLGYSLPRVNSILNSPLFREYAAEIQRELRDSTLGTLISKIEAEALPSLDVILGIRDNTFPDDPPTSRVRLDAAKFIVGDLHMDRRSPKVTKQEQDGTLHISFGPDALRQMLSAQGEATDTIITLETPNTFERATTICLPAPPHGPDAQPIRGQSNPTSHARPTPPILAVSVNELLDELEEDEDTARRPATPDF